MNLADAVSKAERLDLEYVRRTSWPNGYRLETRLDLVALVEVPSFPRDEDVLYRDVVVILADLVAQDWDVCYD